MSKCNDLIMHIANFVNTKLSDKERKHFALGLLLCET
jgi:hypothetical protein